MLLPLVLAEAVRADAVAIALITIKLSSIPLMKGSEKFLASS